MALLRRRECVYLLSSTGLSDGKGDAQNSVSAKLALVGSAVERVEELVNLGLVLDIKVLLDQSRANDGVDVGDGLGNTLASPLSLVAIAEFNSLVLTCDSRLRPWFGKRRRGWSGRTGRGARGDDSPVQAGLSDEIDLNGGVTTRIVDGTSVNLGNGHLDGLLGSFVWF